MVGRLGTGEEEGEMDGETEGEEEVGRRPTAREMFSAKKK